MKGNDRQHSTRRAIAFKDLNLSQTPLRDKFTAKRFYSFVQRMIISHHLLCIRFHFYKIPLKSEVFVDVIK